MFDACATKSALKKALKKQLITVNGKIATTATLLKGGEHIELLEPELTQPTKQLVFPLEVLLEDDYLAVVHKPAGILVSGNSFKTIARALPQNLKPSEHPNACTPQPVHRLDYATTGLLLVGKTSTSIRKLNNLFEEKSITKIYYAVTIGKMSQKETITELIDGKTSETYFEVKKSVTSDRFELLNLVQLFPKTGRRHQLRKHLAGIGNPILGDRDYGSSGKILKGKGLYLHASSLEFTHPFTQEPLYISSKLPKRFLKIFKDLQITI